MTNELIERLRQAKKGDDLGLAIAPVSTALLDEAADALEHQQEIIDRVALLRLDLEVENKKMSAALREIRDCTPPDEHKKWPHHHHYYYIANKALAALDKDNDRACTKCEGTGFIQYIDLALSQPCPDCGLANERR